jgi:uncharacterized protein (TIGR02996 family)
MTVALTEQEQLIRAVLLNPADDTVRLAYADWLQENGQPDHAEFIRVQVELDAFKGDWGERERQFYRREKKLKDQYLINYNGWAKELKPAPFRDSQIITAELYSSFIERGFLNEIRLPLQAFFDYAKDLFSHHPITKVVLTDYQVRYNDVVCPNFLYLTERVLDALPTHYVELINAISDLGITRLEQSDICVRFGRRWAGLTE